MPHGSGGAVSPWGGCLREALGCLGCQWGSISAGDVAAGVWGGLGWGGDLGLLLVAPGERGRTGLLASRPCSLRGSSQPRRDAARPAASLGGSVRPAAAPRQHPGKDPTPEMGTDTIHGVALGRGGGLGAQPLLGRMLDPPGVFPQHLGRARRGAGFGADAEAKTDPVVGWGEMSSEHPNRPQVLPACMGGDRVQPGG